MGDDGNKATESTCGGDDNGGGRFAHNACAPWPRSLSNDRTAKVILSLPHQLLNDELLKRALKP